MPLKDAIFNIGHTAMIIAAICQGKIEALKGAFADKLHQPYRADLIPGMYDVFAAANSKRCTWYNYKWSRSNTYCLYDRKW